MKNLKEKKLKIWKEKLNGMKNEMNLKIKI